jgi:branched-subunit amino acid ABC-type transport system permease component
MIAQVAGPIRFLTPLLDGLSWGIMLVLIAVGLTLIFGFLEVVNFAHGAFYMLGGYLVFSTVNTVGNFWLGLVVAVVIVGLLGALTEITLLRTTYDLSPITQLLILIGFGLIIEGGVILVWGNRGKSVSTPNLLADSVQFMGITYPQYRIFQLIVGSVIIALLWIFLPRSSIGLAIRASLVDTTMARSLGYDIPQIYTLVFASGVAIAALAGGLMTPIRGIDPGTGATILLQAFIVVVVGGLGSFRGTVVAGLFIGITDVLVARYISFQLSGLTVIFILLVVLVVRPRGLFGEEGVMES